eukprot:jgi/Bigna1/76362/fgenesh1_pg.40_\
MSKLFPSFQVLLFSIGFFSIPTVVPSKHPEATNRRRPHYSTPKQLRLESSLSGDHHHRSRHECPPKFYTSPLIHGGLTNALMRLYNHARFAKWSRYTMTMPLIRSYPCIPPSKLIPSPRFLPLNQFFNSSIFCNHLRSVGVCIDCHKIPPSILDQHSLSLSPIIHQKYNHYILKEQFYKKCNHSQITFSQRMLEGNTVIVGQDGLDIYATKNYSHLYASKYSNPYDSFIHFVSSLQITEELEGVVLRTIAKLKRPYLAIHMRVEDDWRRVREGKCYISAEQIVEMVTEHASFKNLLRKTTHPRLSVFIATGAKSVARRAWENVPFIKVVQAADYENGDREYYDADSAGAQQRLRGDLSLSWQQRALIDMEIARRSDMFVGAKLQSTFSKAVQALRAISIGTHTDTTSFAYSKVDPLLATYGAWNEVGQFQCFS